MDALPGCVLKFNTCAPRSPTSVSSVAAGMPEEVKTLQESRANSTCACVWMRWSGGGGGEGEKKAEGEGAKLSAEVGMKEKRPQCKSDCCVFLFRFGKKKQEKFFFPPLLMFVQ